MSEQGTGRITPIGLHRALDAIWRAPKGLAALSTVNHSVVGRRFIVTAFVFFAIGGLMAMLMRAQLARPQNPFFGPEVYNQLFTLHGTVMMFLFAIPLIEGVALYLLPKLLGARDLAYPRLSAFGYWCYLFGGVAILASFVFGVAPDGGWFMYVPLASKAYSPGINADVWLLGVTFVEVSAICAAAAAPLAALIPGTTSTGTPAARATSASSPPRPKMKGSPPFRRTTSSPARARRTSRSLICSCGSVWCERRLATEMSTASARAVARIAGSTSPSWTMVWARSINRAARIVRRSGSPGPAPTR